LLSVCVAALVLLGGGCDTFRATSGTWTGLAVPVELVDAEGRSETALALTVWSGPRPTQRVINVSESIAQTSRRDSGPRQYVLIRSDHIILSPDESMQFRAVEVKGTISEAGYEVYAGYRRRLGRGHPPAGRPNMTAMIVHNIRRIGQDATGPGG
jgi:hypothetical protein